MHCTFNLVTFNELEWPDLRSLVMFNELSWLDFNEQYSLLKQQEYRFFWLASDKYTVCKARANNNTVDYKHTTLWKKSIGISKFPREAFSITKCLNRNQ